MYLIGKTLLLLVWTVSTRELEFEDIVGKI